MGLLKLQFCAIPDVLILSALLAGKGEKSERDPRTPTKSVVWTLGYIYLDTLYGVIPAPALTPEHLCPSRRTRRISPVWFGLRSAQRRGHPPGLRRRSDQV